MMSISKAAGSPVRTVVAAAPPTTEPRVPIGSAGGDEWTRHVARCPEHAEGQRRRIENEQSSERDGERG